MITTRTFTLYVGILCVFMFSCSEESKNNQSYYKPSAEVKAAPPIDESQSLEMVEKNSIDNSSPSLINADAVTETSKNNDKKQISHTETSEINENQVSNNTESFKNFENVSPNPNQLATDPNPYLAINDSDRSTNSTTNLTSNDDELTRNEDLSYSNLLIFKLYHRFSQSKAFFLNEDEKKNLLTKLSNRPSLELQPNQSRQFQVQIHIGKDCHAEDSIQEVVIETKPKVKIFTSHTLKKFSSACQTKAERLLSGNFAMVDNVLTGKTHSIITSYPDMVSAQSVWSAWTNQLFEEYWGGKVSMSGDVYQYQQTTKSDFDSTVTLQQSLFFEKTVSPDNFHLLVLNGKSQIGDYQVIVEASPSQNSNINLSTATTLEWTPPLDSIEDEIGQVDYSESKIKDAASLESSESNVYKSTSVNERDSQLRTYQTPTGYKVLLVPKTKQETNTWCWLASSKMAIDYYYQQTFPQCQLASNFLNVKQQWYKNAGYKQFVNAPAYQCCGNEQACGTVGYSTDVVSLLYQNGVVSQSLNRAISFNDVVNLIDRKNLLIVGTAPKTLNGFAHMMLVVGYDKRTQGVILIDPGQAMPANEQGMTLVTHSYLLNNAYSYWRETIVISQPNTNTNQSASTEPPPSAGLEPGDVPNPINSALEKKMVELELAGKVQLLPLGGNACDNGMFGMMGNFGMMAMSMMDSFMSMVPFFGSAKDKMKRKMFLSALKSSSARSNLLICARSMPSMASMMIKEISNRSPDMLNIMADIMRSDAVFAELFIDLAAQNKEVCHFFFKVVNPALYDSLTYALMQRKTLAWKLGYLLKENGYKQLMGMTPLQAVFYDRGEVVKDADASEISNERLLYSLIGSVYSGHTFLDTLNKLPAESKKMCLDYVMMGLRKDNTTNLMVRSKKEQLHNHHAMIRAMEKSVIPFLSNNKNEADRLFGRFIELMVDMNTMTFNDYGNAFWESALVLIGHFKDTSTLRVFMAMMMRMPNELLQAIWSQFDPAMVEQLNNPNLTDEERFKIFAQILDMFEIQVDETVALRDITSAKLTPRREGVTWSRRFYQWLKYTFQTVKTAP